MDGVLKEHTIWWSVLLAVIRSVGFPPLMSPPRFGTRVTNELYREMIRLPREHATHGTLKYPVSRTEPDDFVLDTFRHLKADDPILELGCNAGNNLVALAKAEHHAVYGLDVEEHCLKSLRARASEEHVRRRVKSTRWNFAKSGSLPSPKTHSGWPKSFKGMYAVHTLSHMSSEHMISVMQRLTDRLEPGGLFVVTNIDPLIKIRVYDRFRAHFGYVQHKEADIMRAFSGLDLVQSRKFHSGELRKTLKTSDQEHLYRELLKREEQLTWYVFRKPVRVSANDKAVLLPQLGEPFRGRDLLEFFPPRRKVSDTVPISAKMY
jgi:SAM-dependent methyltransferase